MIALSSGTRVWLAAGVTDLRRGMYGLAALVADLQQFLLAKLRQVSKKSDLAGAIQYTLTQWDALGRFCHDGRIEIDNNAAERALRAVALGRKNYLFAGADCGGERAAALYGLIGTCLCRMRHRQLHAERRTMPSRRVNNQYFQHLRIVRSA